MSAKFFGQFLLERGRINREQLLVAVELQKHVNVKLGTLAIDKGFMTLEQVDRINRMQRTVDKRFGELAVEQGLLNEAQVVELLENQKQERLLLGEALVKKEFLTFEALAAELDAFRNDQAAVPSSIAEVYAGDPNALVLETFADVLEKLFLRIGHEIVRAGACHHDAGAAALHDFTVSQAFRGSFSGTACLNLSADILQRIASCMLGEDVSGPDEDACDGAAEFLNIVSGNVCAKLSSLGKPCEIRPPEVHDNRGGVPFDLAGLAQGGRLTATPLHHPESGIEFVLVERSA